MRDRTHRRPIVYTLSSAKPPGSLVNPAANVVLAPRRLRCTRNFTILRAGFRFILCGDLYGPPRADRTPLPPRYHFARLFDTLDSRVEHIAGYVATALTSGIRTLVVAEAQHWALAAERLTALDLDLPRLQAEGQLIVQPIDDLLPTLLREGCLDVEQMERHFGSLIRTLTAHDQPLRMYGELADVLVRAGQLSEALKVERFDARLSEDARFTGLCGYSAHHFRAPEQADALRQVCDTHDHVDAAPHDTLSHFLLASHLDARPC